MARGVAFPDEHDDELILCAPSVEVGPGGTVVAVRVMEPVAKGFLARKLIVDEPADGWEIDQLKIASIPQMVGGGVPAVMFAPTTSQPIELMIITPNIPVELHATNRSAERRRLTARLVGHEIMPDPTGRGAQAVRDFLKR